LGGGKRKSGGGDVNMRKIERKREGKENRREKERVFERRKEQDK
jgi:hypothetical protein